MNPVRKSHICQDVIIGHAASNPDPGLPVRRLSCNPGAPYFVLFLLVKLPSRFHSWGRGNVSSQPTVTYRPVPRRRPRRNTTSISMLIFAIFGAQLVVLWRRVRSWDVPRVARVLRRCCKRYAHIMSSDRVKEYGSVILRPVLNVSISEHHVTLGSHQDVYRNIMCNEPATVGGPTSPKQAAWMGQRLRRTPPGKPLAGGQLPRALQR